MKNLHSIFSTLLVMISVAAIVGCSKYYEPAPAIKCKISIIKEHNAMVASYEYDNKERISRIMNFTPNAPASYVTFQYSPTSINYENKRVDDVVVFSSSATKGANGYITRKIDQSNVSPGVVFYDTATYEYNAEGYMIKQTKRHRSTGASPTREVTVSEYTYANGNRVSGTEIKTRVVMGMSINFHTQISYEYYTDKANPGGGDEAFWYNLMGKPNKNMVKTEIHRRTDGPSAGDISTYSYTYEFNADGYPTRRVLTTSYTSGGNTQVTSVEERNFVYHCL